MNSPSPSRLTWSSSCRSYPTFPLALSGWWGLSVSLHNVTGVQGQFVYCRIKFFCLFSLWLSHSRVMLGSQELLRFKRLNSFLYPLYLLNLGNRHLGNVWVLFAQSVFTWLCHRVTPGVVVHHMWPLAEEWVEAPVLRKVGGVAVTWM